MPIITQCEQEKKWLRFIIIVLCPTFFFVVRKSAYLKVQELPKGSLINPKLPKGSLIFPKLTRWQTKDLKLKMVRGVEYRLLMFFLQRGQSMEQLKLGLRYRYLIGKYLSKRSLISPELLKTSLIGLKIPRWHDLLNYRKDHITIYSNHIIFNTTFFNNQMILLVMFRGINNLIYQKRYHIEPEH